MVKKEVPYQKELIERIKARFPGSEVIKNDPQANYQGIPDLTVLLPGGGWAVFETKRGAKAAKQPNQEHYVNRFNERGFSAFINPSNEEEVLDALQQSCEVRGTSRVPQPE